MKQSSEALNKIQEEEKLRRHLLESGKIRLTPEKQTSQKEKAEDLEKSQKSTST